MFAFLLKTRLHKFVFFSNTGCLHEGTMHTFGSWWHPASPQFGVIACANCSCGTNGEIACARVSCPRTPCDRPYKKTPTDCCDSCPGKANVS